MGLIISLITLMFSPFLMAQNSCYSLFLGTHISHKAEKKFNQYSENRALQKTEREAPKLVAWTHRLKKSEHPYTLYKNGLIQLVYLHLHTKNEERSMEYLKQIDEKLEGFHSINSSLHRLYLNVELKKQQLSILKQAAEKTHKLELELPKLGPNGEVVFEFKKYPDLSTLKLHLDQLIVEVSKLSLDNVSKHRSHIEFSQAELFLTLREVQKIIRKHIYVYNSSPLILKKAEALQEIINPMVENKNLRPTKSSLSQLYRKMFFDDWGFILRGHKYSPSVQELNDKLAEVLPNDFNAQFGSKTMLESFRLNSRMNVFKRITGKVIDRSYFQNMFRFKFLGWSIVAASLWFTNPVEFLQNYNYAQSIARFELVWNDSRYINKMKSLEQEKFIDVASEIYMIMSKDYFKEINGETSFIKDPKSDISPVRTILRAIEKRQEYKEEQKVSQQQKEIALYHTTQTIKLDALTKLAFTTNKKELRKNLVTYLNKEFNAHLSIADSVKLMQWLTLERAEKPIVEFTLQPVSDTKIVNTLERSLELSFDSKTVSELQSIINNYSQATQMSLTSNSIWRDLDTIRLLRNSYLNDYLKAHDQKSYRYQLIEDFAYELTATEFHFSSN